MKPSSTRSRGCWRLPEFDTKARCHSIAQMLSIPPSARYRLPTSSAQQTKDQTVFILVELLRGLSKRRPIFCLVEDVHWIDPSTQEILDLIVGQIEKARILLVVTHRPDYRVRSHGNVSGLTIGRLKRQDTVDMVRWVLGDRLVAIGDGEQAHRRERFHTSLRRRARARRNRSKPDAFRSKQPLHNAAGLPVRTGVAAGFAGGTAGTRPKSAKCSADGRCHRP